MDIRLKGLATSGYISIWSQLSVNPVSPGLCALSEGECLSLLRQGFTDVMLPHNGVKSL